MMATKFEHKELEKIFTAIKIAPNDASIEIKATKNLKKEINALEQLSGILATIGITDLIKLYTAKKLKGGR